MKHDRYFRYMESKYGEEWYEWIDKKFESWSTVNVVWQFQK
jgi:hypothetical protein